MDYGPATLVGQPYRPGMLPYGGSVNCKGIIVYAVPYEEIRRLNDMDRRRRTLIPAPGGDRI